MADPDWEAIRLQSHVKMVSVDSQPKAIRDLIHEFNMNPVMQLVGMGMRDAGEIRDVLETMGRDGTEAAQARFTVLRDARRAKVVPKRAVVVGAGDFD